MIQNKKGNKQDNQTNVFYDVYDENGIKDDFVEIYNQKNYCCRDMFDVKVINNKNTHFLEEKYKSNIPYKYDGVNMQFHKRRNNFAIIIDDNVGDFVDSNFRKKIDKAINFALSIGYLNGILVNSGLMSQNIYMRAFNDYYMGLNLLVAFNQITQLTHFIIDLQAFDYELYNLRYWVNRISKKSLEYIVIDEVDYIIGYFDNTAEKQKMFEYCKRKNKIIYNCYDECFYNDIYGWLE